MFSFLDVLSKHEIEPEKVDNWILQGLEFGHSFINYGQGLASGIYWQKSRLSGGPWNLP